MKILVTGAFGNVGEKVLDKLIQKNYDIRIFELKSLKNWIKSFKYKPSCEIMWGNLLNKKSVRKAVEGVDVVIHLAAIIPPLADEKPEMAYEVNVNGTKNIIAEIERIEKENRPKLIYTSSIAIYGDRRKNPHIHVEDELKPNDIYGKQKLEAENAVKDSFLTYSIFRLSYIVAFGNLKMSPLMYEMPLDTHLEICSPEDVALAVKNAIQNDDVWGKIFNIGGGRKCRTTYKEYLGQMMKLFGMGNNLPDSAFSEGPFHCGWLNTEDSASLLKYQKTTLNDFYKRVKRRFLGLRIVLWLFRPLARKIILNYSKYYHKRQSKIASWTKSKVLS